MICLILENGENKAREAATSFRLESKEEWCKIKAGRKEPEISNLTDKEQSMRVNGEQRKKIPNYLLGRL